MDVRSLIEELRKMDPDATVVLIEESRHCIKVTGLREEFMSNNTLLDDCRMLDPMDMEEVVILCQ